jgi:hypothetical protein
MTGRRAMGHLLPIIVSLVVLFTVPISALAQDRAADSPAATSVANTFEIALEPGADAATIARGYFVYELAPDAEKTGRVRLRNTGAEPVIVELRPVDAETAQTGGSAFAATEAKPVAAGRWIRLKEPRVTLASGEQVSVKFTVSPPPGTAPSQYLAGIAAYTPVAPDRAQNAAGANQAGAGITLQTRYVIGVQVDVPGEWVPSIRITGAEVLERMSSTQLGIAMRNDGDTFLKPEGSVTLTNADAKLILSQPIKLDTFVTGTEILYPVAWPGVPVGGEYGVDVELNYADDKVARYRGMFTIRDDAPIAPSTPGEEMQRVAQSERASAPSPFQPSMLIAAGGLLALVVILLSAAFIRGRRSSW